MSLAEGQSETQMALVSNRPSYILEIPVFILEQIQNWSLFSPKCTKLTFYYCLISVYQAVSYSSHFFKSACSCCSENGIKYFIMAGQTLSPSLLKDIFQTEYELRTPLQHQTAIDFIISLHPHDCTLEQAKMLSFFFAGPPQLPEEDPHSLYPPEPVLIQPHSLVVRYDETLNSYEMQQLQEKMTFTAANEDLVLILEENNLRKCEVLNWLKPDLQVKFLQSCSLLCEIPKKRLYPLLRHSSIERYRIGELAFKEGSPMKNCYYLIRSGEFSFCRTNHLNKFIELMSFKAGYIYQHEARSISEGNHAYDSIFSGKMASSPNFDFTVKCKSSKGVIYCIDIDFFHSQFLKFCEEPLQKHLNNQIKYLQGRKVNLDHHKRSFSQTTLQQRPQSQLFPLTAPVISSARQAPPSQPEKKVLDLFQKIADYKTLRDTLPKRNRLYSKAELKKIYPNPESDQSQSLLWRKAKCDEMKKVTKGPPSSARPKTRGQILYGFTQFTIKFQKNKKKSLISSS